MKFWKRLLSVTLAVLIMVLSGCSNDYSSYVEIDTAKNKPGQSDKKDDDTDASQDPSDQASQNHDKVQTIMSLQQDGSLVINRGVLASKSMGPAGTQTIFVYMCGSDLESKNGMATYDLQEMISASTGQNVRFVVQTGGADSWKNDIVSSAMLQRYVISGGSMVLADETSDASMGSAETLSDFLSWGVTAYPAAKMGLVFWNHGGGSISGVCFDEKYDYDSLTMVEIQKALQDNSVNMTDQFEFVGFDACLMATLETANILTPYARYMVASEETEPGYGWDYTALGNYLGSHPDADGASIGQVICDSFYDSCSQCGQQGSATMSVVDLSKMDPLLMLFHDYSREIYNDTEDTQQLAYFARKTDEMEYFGAKSMAEGYNNMVDLADMFAIGQEFNPQLPDYSHALNEAVIYTKNGQSHFGACGLSIYFPLYFSGSTELKVFSEIATSPYYLSLVNRKAYGNINSGSTDDFDDSGAISLWGDTWSESSDVAEDSSEYDEYWADYSDVGSSNTSTLIEFYDEPDFYDNNGIVSFGCSVTDESLLYIQAIDARVWTLEGDDVLDVGITGDVICDWESGIFFDNFDGLWFCLPDGQELTAEVVYEEGYWGIYVARILLNGEEQNLRFMFNIDTRELILLGTWSGLSENGMAGRDFYQLQVGDTVVPIYPITNGDEDDYYIGQEYTFTSEPTINLDALRDGEYYYNFILYDIYGNSLETELVHFSIEGGEIYYYDG